MTNKTNKTVGAAMVLGGGIGGMQAALDLAESGIKVYFVDKDSAIGGRMVQLDKTFPTNECAMCVVSPKLVDCARHGNIEIITNSEIESISGKPGNFQITLKKKPRYVDEDKCTGCGSCVINCPVRYQVKVIPDEERQKVKLADDVKPVVDKIIADNKSEKGALMLTLQAINASYNYFSEDVLRYVSDEMEVPLTTVMRTVTFYNAFSLKPRGRHTISVCMGTTCYVKGSGQILSTLSDILDTPVEETTKDMKFTLKSVRCLGCCSIAPAVMINDKVYGHVKLNELSKILEDYK